MRARPRHGLLPAAAVVLAAAAVSAAAARVPRAPLRLADTGLYVAGHPGASPQVDPRNRSFSPQYPLWSDGATKARWIYMPPGTVIDTSDPDGWRFPVGTRFWKEFTFDGRKVETRFLWRATATRWVFASYQWNADGTDAVLVSDSGAADAATTSSGRAHAIPSVTECRACHEGRRVEPLGFNALQLSTDRDPMAIHGEPLAPGMVTVKTLNDERRLAPARPELVTTPLRIESRSPIARAAIGYMTTNCGGCHNPGTGIALLGASLRHTDVRNGDAVVAAMVRHRTTWQVPGVPVGESRLIDPDTPNNSALLARMRSRRPSSQMPPLGTVMEDRAALELIARWIGTELSRPR